MQPKVSVVMSAYNGGRYLQAAIESILGQTYPDFEFIIIEDGSSDNSLETLREYAGRDERIRLIENHENIGLALSLNKGIEAAGGKYIARMDADDISLPGRFARQLDYLESHPKIWVLGSGIQIIDENGKVLRNVDYSNDPEVLRWNMMLGAEGIVCHPASMLRKELFETIGIFKDIPTSQDHELWTRLFFMKDLPITNLPDVLLSFRDHADRVSTSKRELQNNMSNEIRIRLINKFMGTNIPKEVSAAYREIRNETYFFKDINGYMNSWFEIHRKFIITFDISVEAQKIIWEQLLFRLGSYLSVNPIHLFTKKRPSLWIEIAKNKDLSFHDYKYLISVNRGLRGAIRIPLKNRSSEELIDG
jgi:glycosyltransferase involved in cell wall biosynthesis